jgi:hypothetical protein
MMQRKNLLEIQRKAIEKARRDIIKELSLRRREAPFLVWFFSIVGFYGARLFVVLFPNTNFMVFGYHIHHLYYGVVLVLLAGSLALTFKGVRLGRLSAIFYGLGLGIIMDELGLFLTEGNYWAEVSYIVFFTFLALSAIMLFFWDFWTSGYGKQIRKKLGKIFMD